jgi:formylglycine-generating enzyme required for sulfatase activity
MGKFTVTQVQYDAVMRGNPSSFSGPDNPVESVSWIQATDFCAKLNEKLKAILPDGMKLQLPTEAQWEYACRAGTKTRFYTGDDKGDLARAGWYSTNSDSKTHPVGQKTPNAFGLYDMHGNVFQWCQDAYRNGYEYLTSKDPFNAQGANRVLRGGSWIYDPRYCRSASRSDYSPDIHGNNTGFRVVLSVPSSRTPP